MNHASADDLLLLKKELVGMFGHIQRIRKELASIHKPGNPGEDHFAEMADQLDAIVEATESATNTIMGSVEEIEAEVGKLRASSTDPAARAAFDRIGERTSAVFEACSFQDITGQRVTKVVNSLKFVEERVNALIRMWGREELAKVVVEINEDKDPDRRLLNGPQRRGQGVSQADVDQMFSDPPKIEFNQDDIDKLFG